MKPLALGLVLLTAVTGLSLLGRDGAGTAAPPHTPMVVPERPSPSPGEPEWTVLPIPTDGWDQGGLLHR